MPAKNQLGGLKESTVHGIRWNAASIAISTALQIAQMIWLAHLLTPGDFGVMAMAWVVIRCASPIFAGGIGQSIIQQKEISREQFSTLFWLQTALGALTFAGVCLSVPLWVNFFEETRVAGLLLVCSLSFLIAPSGITIQALLTRRMMFDKLAAVQLSGSIADAVVSVWMATRGWGPLSICWGYFARNLVSSIMAAGVGRNDLPMPVVRVSNVRPMLKFALFETGNNLTFAFHTMLDKAILSRFLTAHELGLYFLAWELAMAPLSKISPVFTRVSFPLFSKIQDQPGQLNHYFLSMTQALMAVSLPVLLMTGILATPALTVFFGAEWAAAGTCLSLLSIFGLGKVVSNSGAGIFLAKGRSDCNFFWNLSATASIFFLLLVFLSASPSLEAAAVAQITALILVSGLWAFLLNRIGEIQIKPLLRVLIRRTALSFPMVLATLPWVLFIESPTITLAGGLASGILIYFLALFLFDREMILKLIR